MRDSSYGGAARQLGDCSNPPDIAVYYDGNSVTVPTFAAGVIKFGGGVSWDTGRGIGYSGAATKGEFSIVFDDILKGGAGVKIRACLAPTAKKVRMKCCAPTCVDGELRMYLQGRQILTCENQIQGNQNWIEPIEVEYLATCITDCTAMIAEVVKQITANPNSPYTAAAVTISGVPGIELTAKTAGVDFQIFAWEGLTAPETIVPNTEQQFSAKQVKEWFPNDPIGPCDANKCLAILEIWYWNDVPSDPGMGNITSAPVSDVSKYVRTKRHASIVFDPAITQSNTAFTALKTLLTGSTEYNKVLLSTVADDSVTYPFCITRPDAGDDAALATMNSDYTTNKKSLVKSNRIGSTTYYTFRGTSATPPTPVTPGGGSPDVVTVGACGPLQYPCPS